LGPMNGARFDARQRTFPEGGQSAIEQHDAFVPVEQNHKASETFQSHLSSDGRGARGVRPARSGSGCCLQIRPCVSFKAWVRLAYPARPAPPSLKSRRNFRYVGWSWTSNTLNQRRIDAPAVCWSHTQPLKSGSLACRRGKALSLQVCKATPVNVWLI